MRAALLVAPSKIEVHDVNEPIVGRNEVKVKPIRAGICGTDVSLFLGHRTAISYPLILGHELVARVVAVGEDVRNIKVGQRVVVEPNYPCGKCGLCLSGRGNICSKKQSMGVTVPGCFADCVTAPSEFVWPLPDSVSDSDAATIEPLAVSLHALFQSRARIGDTIAVLGCGVIGLLLIHAAVRQGITVLAHDKIDEKVQFARRLGAITHGSKELKDLREAEGVVAVFECAGAAATVELALSSAPRGSCVLLLGLSSSIANFVPLRFVREGIRLEGSIIYDHPADFARCIALVEAGILQPSCVVSDTFQFGSIAKAIELASVGRAAKVQISD